MAFTFIDLFAGIGGFRLALEAVGGKCVAFSEINNSAIKTYSINFNTKEEIFLGDITKVNNFPKADAIVGGVPCQSWSIAGKNKGFDDIRGKLWLDTIRAVKLVQPKFFIFENVKGLADPRNKDSLDFIIKQFKKLGYDVHYKVLNSNDFGMIQSRDRVFLVGFNKKIKFNFPKEFSVKPMLKTILDNKISLESFHSVESFTFSDIRNGDNTIHSWDLITTSQDEKSVCLTILQNRRKKAYGTKDGNPMSYEDILQLNSKTTLSLLKRLVSKKILRQVSDKYEFVNSKNSSGINGIYRVYMPNSNSFPTLTASGNLDFVSLLPIPKGTKDIKEYFLKEIFHKNQYRKLSVLESIKLQGFPHSYKFNQNTRQSFKQLGNAIPVKVVELIALEVIKSLKIKS